MRLEPTWIAGQNLAINRHGLGEAALSMKHLSLFDLPRRVLTNVHGVKLQPVALGARQVLNVSAKPTDTAKSGQS